MKNHRRHPQILIIVDIMTLLVFMYISTPKTSSIEGKFFVDCSGGFVDGTVFYVKTRSEEVKAYLEQNSGIIKEHSDKDRKGSIFNEFRYTPTSACAKKVNYDGNYHHINIRFPDQVMIKAYTLQRNYCEEYKCNGNIYIKASVGEVFICSEDGYFRYVDTINGKIESYEKCKY